MNLSIKDNNVFKDITKSILVGSLFSLSLTSFSSSNYKSVEINNEGMKPYIYTQFNNYNKTLNDNEITNFDDSFSYSFYNDNIEDVAVDQIDYCPNHSEFEIDLNIVKLEQYKPVFDIDSIYEGVV